MATDGIGVGHESRPSIEAISAVTLATIDMARAVRFYRALGFEMRYGDESATFTSFAAGGGFLNLIAQPPASPGAWWAGSSSTYET